MKTMKNLLALLLCLVLAALPLSGCAGKGVLPSDAVPAPRGETGAAPETKPVETEPVKTEPVKTEPAETEPIETEPIETEPVETGPVIPEDAGELRFLYEAETDWTTETWGPEMWVGRRLTLFPDGSLYYREGMLLSEYVWYQDGLWQTVGEDLLVLTLWESPYDGWSRPEDYRAGQADVPADAYEVRFTVSGGEQELNLTQETEAGFPDCAKGTVLCFRPAEVEYPYLDGDDVLEILERDEAELESLPKSDSFLDLFGYGGKLRFAGVTRAGDMYLGKLTHSAALTISESELAEMQERGTIVLQGVEYQYSNDRDVAASYGDMLGDYGNVYHYRNAGDSYPYDAYWIQKAGDRYYFVHEIGGLTTRIEEITDTWWLWLDPDTPLELGPFAEEQPGTLDAYGSFGPNWIAAPFFDQEDGTLSVYVDMR